MPAQNFSKANLLAQVASCTAFSVCRVSEVIKTLNTSVQTYVADPSKENLTAAQLAHRDAMLVWARLAPNDFGPGGSPASDPNHGKSQNVLLHAWPAVSRCEVEKQVALRGYETSFDQVPAVAKGLYAMEYLLFFGGEDTVCAANSQTYAAFQDMSSAELAEAKRDYLLAVAKETSKQAKQLWADWSADGGNFEGVLRNAEGYSSKEEALTIAAWSFLYVYDEVRDRKIAPRAQVLGTSLNPETPFVDLEKETVLQNLAAFRDLFFGCAKGSLGYDDWLTEAGAGELRDDIIDALGDAEAKARALPSYSEATAIEMKEFYDVLKVLTDLVKGNLLGSASPINIKLPVGVASDTD